MYAIKDLQTLLDISIKWEKQLKDLYEVAEIGVKNRKSKELIQYLLAKQTSIVEVLTDIDVHKYGQDEFVMYTPENHTEDLIPQHELTSKSEPETIIKLIKSYEVRLEAYYSDIADHLVSDSQKELFQSLVTLKEAQLEALNNFIREHLKQAI